MSKKLCSLIAVLLALAMLMAACAPAAAPAPTQAPAQPQQPAQPEPTKPAAPAPAAGSFQIPEIQDGKFNIAAVLIGPHDDGGWSQAHYEGLKYVEQNVPNVHVAYIENVPEGADSEQVLRSLSRKGFKLILGTSFGYMDPMETVAGEFPDTMYVHIAGY